MNSVFNVLTIIFVIAKLGGLITWPWLWCFAPAIFGFALGVIGFLLIYLFTAWAKSSS